MTARTPEEVHLRWLRAVNEGDIETLVTLCEPEATVVFGPDQVVTGLDAIRTGNQGLLALRPRFELRVAQVLRSGNLALLLSDWSMTGTGPDGTPVTAQGTTTDVVRRQPDGSWRFAIDNPTGTAGIGAAPQG
jgi:uncharacterized protein (TIGR02246 family)